MPPRAGQGRAQDPIAALCAALTRATGGTYHVDLRTPEGLPRLAEVIDLLYGKRLVPADVRDSCMWHGRGGECDQVLTRVQWPCMCRRRSCFCSPSRRRTTPSWRARRLRPCIRGSLRICTWCGPRARRTLTCAGARTARRRRCSSRSSSPASSSRRLRFSSRPMPARGSARPRRASMWCRCRPGARATRACSPARSACTWCRRTIRSCARRSSRPRPHSCSPGWSRSCSPRTSRTPSWCWSTCLPGSPRSPRTCVRW